MRLERGPALQKFRARGLKYPDVTDLLTAYEREHPPRLETAVDEQGRPVEELVWGRRTSDPPDPPWPEAVVARQRNAEIRAEIDATSAREQGATQPAGGDGVELNSSRNSSVPPS